MILNQQSLSAQNNLLDYNCLVVEYLITSRMMSNSPKLHVVMVVVRCVNLTNLLIIGLSPHVRGTNKFSYLRMPQKESSHHP